MVKTAFVLNLGERTFWGETKPCLAQNASTVGKYEKETHGFVL